MWSAVNSEKTCSLEKITCEPAIWSRGTGQLTITWMSKIRCTLKTKDVDCSMTAMLWEVAVVFVVFGTRPRSMPLAMLMATKELHGFFLFMHACGSVSIVMVICLARAAGAPLSDQS